MATVTVDSLLKPQTKQLWADLNGIRGSRSDTGLEVFMLDNDMSARGPATGR